MTIDLERVFRINSPEALKAKAFELMLTQEDYNGFDLFITEIHYRDWTFLLFKDKCNTLTLRFEKAGKYTQWKVFFSMGGCWRFIFEEILQIKVI